MSRCEYPIRVIRAWALVLVTSLSVGCAPKPPHLFSSARWVWAGDRVPVQASETRLYIHQGTFERDGHGFVPQGPTPRAFKDKDLLLVFRIESLVDARDLVASLKLVSLRWRQRGNHVLGVQLDFDSPTRKLDAYVAYLRQVRALLPPGELLSVTGLADWAAQASPQVVEELGSVCDEIVFQLYNGRSPLRGLDTYLPRLASLKVPFKIGLLAGMSLEESRYQKIIANPHFQGGVVFHSGRDQL